MTWDDDLAELRAALWDARVGQVRPWAKLTLACALGVVLGLALFALGVRA